jgi:nicotinamide phosphoribosyltransferase
MIREGWSIDNIAFGMGGGLLQKVNRDTQRFAFKCSSVVVKGEERDVFKEPLSDPTKNSKRGRLALIKNMDGQYRTVSEVSAGNWNRLQTVFERGECTRLYTLDEIREKAAAPTGSLAVQKTRLVTS